MMDIRLPLIVSAAALAVALAVSAYAWQALPEGARLVVQWGVDGKPGNTEPKEIALLLLPGLMLALSALFAVMSRLDPRGENLARSARLYIGGWLSGIAVMLVGHLAIVATALGSTVPVHEYLVVLLAGTMIVIGNVLGKTRSNFFAGIRTPWSLSSELAWEKTHRWGGRLFVLVGLLGLVAWVALPWPWPLGLLVAGSLATTFAGVVISYLVWRRDPDRHQF